MGSSALDSSPYHCMALTEPMAGIVAKRSAFKPANGCGRLGVRGLTCKLSISDSLLRRVTISTGGLLVMSVAAKGASAPMSRARSVTCINRARARAASRPASTWIQSAPSASMKCSRKGILMRGQSKQHASSSACLADAARSRARFSTYFATSNAAASALKGYGGGGGVAHSGESRFFGAENDRAAPAIAV